MKEILIVSGKGGTGKTSVTAAIASLAKNSVFADCDVDAADLHLILNPEVKNTNDFYSGHLAHINQSSCVSCGICKDVCRFDAIKLKGDKYFADTISCEGCGVCVWSCPQSAIGFDDNLCGQWYISQTRFGKMVHARLNAAAENSGKLVSTVRNEAKNLAQDNNCDYVIIDGPPGIGCPVIASMTGVNNVIIVTEPTLSGLHDMVRVIELARHFSVEAYICINKYDLNTEIKEKIKILATEHGIPVIGEIPYEKDVTMAQINGKTLIEYSDSPAARAVEKMWNTFLKTSE